MKDTIRLGRIAGIPIGVNWSILAVAAYLVLSLTFGALPRWWPSADLQARLITSGSITVLFFASILGHELGHAAAARRHDVGVDGITLWVLGGIAKLRRQAPTPRAEFDIAFAGPAASLALGVGFVGVALGIDRWTTWSLAASAASWLAITNVFLGLSNLVPIAPLDGGRVLTALLWRTSDDAEHARLISARAGLVVGIIVAVGSATAFVFFSSLSWWVFALTFATGLFIAHAAWREVIGAVIRARLTNVTLGSVMSHRPSALPSDLTIEGFVRSTVAGPAIGRPVVRWAAEPIGYINPVAGQSFTVPERSWTSITSVMIPVDHVLRAWSTETLAEFLDRSSEDALAPSAVIVVHDPSNGLPIGTLTPQQITPFFATPNPWGVSSDPPPPNPSGPLQGGSGPGQMVPAGV